jgi:hypothetical protein
VFSTQTNKTMPSSDESIQGHHPLFPSILPLNVNITNATAATAEVAMLKLKAAPEPILVHRAPKTEFAMREPMAMIV